MNYIGFLTQEEKAILCEIITGRDFKEWFKKNESEFSKIQKGFRAKSLTEQRALSIAKTNVDKPFVATYMNKRVEIWLKEIQDNIEKLEKEGLNPETALATTMIDSVFSENVTLYYKLICKEINDDGLINLYKSMESIKFEREREAAVDIINSLEDEKQLLTEQIEIAKSQIKNLTAEYEDKIQRIIQDKTELEISLNEARERVSELKEMVIVDPSNNPDSLKQFDDTDTSLLPVAGSAEIVSLCGVISDYNGQTWLARYADLSHEGNYNIFYKSDNIPPFFTNRDKIYFKDGPSEVGFVGVWIWSAESNEKDPSKDYVRSRFNYDLEAVEVVVIKDVSNMDDLVSILKEGVSCKLHSNRVLFTLYESKGKCTGVLCNLKELVIENAQIRINEKCIELPIYEFSKSDILRINKDLLFFRKAFVGIPSKLYRLKSNNEIVKSIVFSSVSWAAYKTRGFVHSEFKEFKEFIGLIPTDDIVGKIEVACRCTTSEAQTLLDEFLDVIWQYMDGKSVEDEIIISAISASEVLQEKAKTFIRKDWETENESLLNAAQKELDSIRSDVEAARESLNEAEESFVETKLEEERLAGIIAEKEELAEKVETAVSERIQRARENVADFLAEMAFIGGKPIPETSTGNFISESKPDRFSSTSYGLLLMHVGFGLTDSVENACTGKDRNGEKICFNPSFLDGISDEELLYVMEHEVLHLALRHFARSAPFSPERFNIACDIVVDSNILKSNGMDEKYITLRNSGGVQRHKAPDGREGYEFSAEELYYLIPEPDGDPIKGPGSKADDFEKGRAQKKKGEAKSGRWDDHITSLPEIEDDDTIREVWVQRIVNAAETVEIREKSNGRGTIPAFAERMLRELRRPQTDWQTILNDFIQEEICDYSFSPPDRRFDESPFFLPDFNEKEDNVKDILFMVDTSGSMSDTMITAAFSEVKGAIDQFGGKLKGWLGFFDAAVIEPQPFESEDEFRIIRAYGGGGTDFQIIFEYVAQHMADTLPASIIILTDGYAPFPQEHLAMGIPVLWVLNNEKVQPPWGKVARIRVNQ